MSISADRRGWPTRSAARSRRPGCRPSPCTRNVSPSDHPATEALVRFIDENTAAPTAACAGASSRSAPCCRSTALRIAPATYYAARTLPASLQRLRDEQLKPQLAEMHKANYGVYAV